jgi:hypothetical protein
MTATIMPRAAANDALLNPEYWLVSALEWPGDAPAAEAAVAVVPGLILRDTVSTDADQVLGCADLYARKHGLRVVHFSDLTRMFNDAGTSWRQLGVDWEGALQELQDGQFPAMYLTISKPAYLIICNPTCRAVTLAADTEERIDDERELLRREIAARLVRDWPAYMQSATETGRLIVA